MGTLRTDDDDGAVVGGLANDGKQGIRVAGDVAGAEGLDDDALQPLCHDRIEEVELDAGENLDDADGHVLQPLEGKPSPIGRQQRRSVVADGDARLRQRGIVRRLKGNQVVGGILDGAVAPQQLPAEVQAYLMHLPAGRDQQGCDDVVAGVVADLTQRNLRAGQDHGLAVAPEHEGEGRGGVGHGIGAVEHHKAVVVVVVIGDELADGVPFHDGDVGGIQKRLHVHDIPVGHGLGVKLGNAVKEIMKRILLRGIAGWRIDHADGPAGIDDKDFLHVHHPISTALSVPK